MTQTANEFIDADPPLNVAEAAEYLRTSPATLSYWRHIGRGPAYVKPGKRVFYRFSDLVDWLNSGQVLPEADKTQRKRVYRPSTPNGRPRGRPRKVALAEGAGQ